MARKSIRVLSLAALLLLSVTPAWSKSKFSYDFACNGMAGGIGHPTSYADMEPVLRNMQMTSIVEKLQHAATSDKSSVNLQTRFDDRHCSCTFAVNPDGTISSLTVQNTAGSPELDKFAVEFIRSVAPFRSLRLLKPVAYAVDFPLLTVKPVK